MEGELFYLEVTLLNDLYSVWSNCYLHCFGPATRIGVLMNSSWRTPGNVKSVGTNAECLLDMQILYPGVKVIPSAELCGCSDGLSCNCNATLLCGALVLVLSIFMVPYFRRSLGVRGYCVLAPVLKFNCDFIFTFFHFAFLPLLFGNEALSYPYSMNST